MSVRNVSAEDKTAFMEGRLQADRMEADKSRLQHTPAAWHVFNSHKPADPSLSDRRLQDRSSVCPDQMEDWLPDKREVTEKEYGMLKPCEKNIL